MVLTVRPGGVRKFGVGLLSTRWLFCAGSIYVWCTVCQALFIFPVTRANAPVRLSTIVIKHMISVLLSVRSPVLSIVSFWCLSKASRGAERQRDSSGPVGGKTFPYLSSFCFPFAALQRNFAVSTEGNNVTSVKGPHACIYPCIGGAYSEALMPLYFLILPRNPSIRLFINPYHPLL